MTSLVAFGAPSPLEILILLLVFGLPLGLVFIIVLLAKRRSRSDAAFPVVPVVPVVPLAEPEGPGRYRVAGVDKNTRADREEVIQADSRANAQVKAELDGIIVTAVNRI